MASPNHDHKNARRIIHHADALVWLREQSVLTDCSIITSLPDISEFPAFSLAEWKRWFVDAAALVMSRCPDDGLTIFYQTDIKRDGVWVDKGFLCQQAAETVDHKLRAHKMVCRTLPGQTTFGRPAYAHLLCFSKGVALDVSQSTADVLPATGQTTWTRGMGVEACKLACRLVMQHTPTRTIVDPFCGHGSVLAVANELGMGAVGVDVSRKCVKIAETLTVAQLSQGTLAANVFLESGKAHRKI